MRANRRPPFVPLLILITSLLLSLGSPLEQQEEVSKFSNNSRQVSDKFNLFNLFNVFRGSKSSLVDQQGNVVPLDGSETGGELKDADPLHQGLFKPAVGNFDLGHLLLLDKFKNSFTTSTTSKRLVRPPSSPIILVPGYGGSRLEARLDKTQAVRYFCDLKSDWQDIWINVKLLLPYMIDCLIDNLRLELDYATNTTRNTPGVEIRVKNGLQISGIEYLNSLPIAGFAYFAPIIEQLNRVFSYERERSILGAPYDFRKAPNELGDYFEQLKGQSEQVFAKNNQQPLTFICHSMGCNNMLYFLHGQSKGWKKRHVKRLISIAAPWGGSVSAMRAAALGDNLGLPYLFSESKLIHVQRSLPSTIYLFPNKKAFPQVPLIRTNVISPLSVVTTNTSDEVDELVYMAEDFGPFFDKINHPDGHRMWLNTKDLLGTLEAPQVEVWCLVGRGQKTLGRLEFMGEFPSSPSMELYGDGDGTVNLQSAEYCNNWSKEQEAPVYYKEFDVGHMEILKDAQVLSFIQNIVEDKKPTMQPRKSSL